MRFSNKVSPEDAQLFADKLQRKRLIWSILWVNNSCNYCRIAGSGSCYKWISAKAFRVWCSFFRMSQMYSILLCYFRYCKDYKTHLCDHHQDKFAGCVWHTKQKQKHYDSITQENEDPRKEGTMTNEETWKKGVAFPLPLWLAFSLPYTSPHVRKKASTRA